MDCCHRLGCWVKPSSIALLGSDAGFRRRVRCDERCGRDGPEWRRRRWDRRTFVDATALDRRVAEVRVIDPHHPLYGGCFPVSERRSGRGAALIVIRLPDGRERAISRAATTLGLRQSALGTARLAYPYAKDTKTAAGALGISSSRALWGT